MDRAQELYDSLKGKLKRTLTVYTIINLVIFLITSGIIVLNIYAIRKNPANDHFTVWVFVAMTVLVTLSGLVGSISSLMVYRKRNKDLTEKIFKIEEEKAHFKSSDGDYAGKVNKDQVIIENVGKILNS